VPQFTKDMFPYRNHYAILSSFMTSHTHMTSNVSYHRVCNKSKTTGATSRGETAYPSGIPAFIVFFCVVLCRPLYFHLFFSTDQCLV